MSLNKPVSRSTVKSLPFYLMHAASISVFFVPFQWKWLALCVGSYYLRMFFITAGYHRYFSHKAFKVNRLTQFIAAFAGSTTVQKGALWWAANHRHHHKYSDQPNDIHSPIQKGFWESHVGWILSDEYEETHWDQIPDLAKFPELRWINQYHLIPVVLYAALMIAIGGAPAFAWGFVLSTVLLWHGTFTINSLSHVYGSVRYKSADTSKNNFWLALLTLGEGWHNNHHAYMSSANQGFFWWEVDFSYYTLKALSWLRITRDLKKAPVKLLEAKRLPIEERQVSPRERRRRERSAMAVSA